MRLLAISGSLRAGSSNTTILEAASRVAPAGMSVWRYPSIAALPHFNPDDDSPDERDVPVPAAEFRELVGQVDGLILSTPEYAHGLPGAFKNALDWLVGSMEFPGKPVAVINVSPRSRHAPEQLREILTTMSAHIIERGSVVLSLPNRDMDADAIVADPSLSAALRSALEELAAEIDEAHRRRERSATLQLEEKG